jgi:Hypothetical glycosyl hydrolase family 15
MRPPHRLPHVTLRRLVPPLFLLGTAFVLVALAIQSGADAAGGPTPGIGIKRWGETYRTASGYDRYSYVNVGPADAAAAGALPTKSLVYTSGTSVYPGWSAGMTYQEALANNWLLKDASGAYLMNVDYGAYVGDIGNPAYQQRFVDNVSALLARNGNEGAFIDDVLATSAGMTGGKFPAKYPTQQAWEDAQVSFVQYVGQALRARGYYVLVQAIAWIAGNPGSDDGSLNAAFWSRLAPHVSGIQSEYWIQDPNDVTRLRATGTAWYQQWDGWLNLMNAAQSRGTDFFAMMYGSTTNVETMRYGRASFLLLWDGSGGAFTYDIPSGDPWNAEWTTAVGQPAGARFQVGVGWRREYTNGTAIVNPSPSTSQTFALGGTYMQADGTAVTRVTLAPTTGLVLTKQAVAPPPPPPAPPANTALPVITGSAQQGATLSASTGSWSNSPTGHAYQWKRCDAAGANCASIGGSTVQQHTLGADDVGRTLRVTVTASNGAGSTSATSNATAVIGPAPSSKPKISVRPTISGTPRVGNALSTTAGEWSNSPRYYAFQWRRCNEAGGACVNIDGATTPRYTVAAADIGRTLRVVVAASNDAGVSYTRSDQTALVAPRPLSPPSLGPDK